MSQFSEYIWPPLQNVPTAIPPTKTGGFAVAPNLPSMVATVAAIPPTKNGGFAVAPNLPNMAATASSIPPSKTVWSAAPPPVNTQVFKSSVLTQRQINTEFNIVDEQLNNQAP